MLDVKFDGLEIGVNGTKLKLAVEERWRIRHAHKVGEGNHGVRFW